MTRINPFNYNYYTVTTCSVTLGTGRTHINVNHGTYRSGELVSGTLTTALYLGVRVHRSGTNTGRASRRAGRWTDRQTDRWASGNGWQGMMIWEQGGNNKRKNNNLAGINYNSKRQNRASDNYKRS